MAMQQVGQFLVIGDENKAAVREDGSPREVFDNSVNPSADVPSAFDRAVKWAAERKQAQPLDKQKIEPENAGLIKKWFAERGGIAIWRSADLLDPSKTWTTPMKTADGGMPVVPHWKCGGSNALPVRVITDMAEVEVETVKVVKEVPVSLNARQHVATLTAGSEKKARKATKEAGPGAFFVTSGDLLFPHVLICVPDKAVPLSDFDHEAWEAEQKKAQEPAKAK